MIRDPGGSSPNENLDSPPSPKYDRIGMLGRPPPLDDTEIPLDMTVRRKDSSDGQGSPTGGDLSRDVPINLNVRPSVITKAPPPPIKKRISHMHTNGEIVLKSSVRTSSSSAVDSKPIVHVSSTYCDVSIEEHFRRSLGPTYSSIYGDKQQLQQQQQQQQPSATALNVLNNNSSAGHGSSFPSYDHQVLQGKHALPVPLLHQKHAMETCETPPTAPTGAAVGGVAPRGTGTVGMRNHSSSSISSSSSVCSNSSSSSSSILGNSNNSNSSSSSTSNSSNNSNSNSSSTNSITIRSIPIAGLGGIRVVAPDTIELKLSSDPAPPIPLMPATVLPPSPGAPSPAAGLVTNVAISLTSPKHQAALLLQHPAPPISPASMTTTGSLASSSPSSSLASSPAPFLTLHSLPQQQQQVHQHQHQHQHQQQQQHQQLKSIPDSGGEVDDHFAKALGDTWKKIQENKMNL